MNKKILLLSLISLSFLNSYAQMKTNKADVFWGDEQKSSKKFTLGDIVGYDETGTYVLKTKIKSKHKDKSTVTIEHYNNQLNRTKSAELKLETKNKPHKFEFMMHHNNELHLFSSFLNSKLKKNFLFVQTVNKKTLLLEDNLKMIAEFEYSDKSLYNYGKFKYDVSQDSSKILIYYNNPYDRGDKESFGCYVFDTNFNNLWGKKYDLDHKEKSFIVEDFEVDNNGNAYLLCALFNERRARKREGAPDYHYQILSYTDNGNKLEEYPVNVDGKFLTDMKIAINKQQDIICAGFYAQPETYNIEGSYFLKIDCQSKEIKSKSFQEFGIDFITQNLTERQEKKSKKRAKKGKNTLSLQYDLDDIILSSDGGAVLIGEQYHVTAITTTTTTTTGTVTATTYTYYYNDILVIHISPDGQIVWTKKIPKKQITTNDNGFFSSYVLSVVKDKLYFVFNDNPNNLHYKGEGKLHIFNKSKESLVVLVELDGEGNQTREALFSADKIDMLSIPKVSEQTSKKELLLYSQKRKSSRFAKITFKN